MIKELRNAFAKETSGSKSGVELELESMPQSLLV